MSTQDHDDSTTRTQTIRLDAEDLDGGGGGCLRGLEGIVRVLGTELRALDVEDSPLLVALDLSGCCDDLRLHLTDLPRLKTLLLPSGSSGATIELSLPSSYTPVTPLVIRGPIADFGVCAPWMVQPWRLDRPIGKPPVDGLAIGPPSENPPSRSVSAHLVVGRACREERLVMNCRGISHLLIMGTRLRDLELRHASLESLQICECPRLERIIGRFQARSARISVCRKLVQVSGSGCSLDIGVVGSPRLALEGHWLDTRVSASDCRVIKLDRPTRLELERMPTLMDIESEVEYDLTFDHTMFDPMELAIHLTGEPGELTRHFRIGLQQFGDRSKLVTHWLRHLATDRHGQRLGRALRALRQVATHPADRRACWLIRSQLAAQAMESDQDLLEPAYAFRRSSSCWDWSLVEDPQPTLWLDDLALYGLCFDLDVVTPFRRTLGRLNQLPQAALLATALASESFADRPATEILDHLRGCLTRLNLATELSRSDSSTPPGLHPHRFHRRKIPWWIRYDAGLERLIDALGRIADEECSRYLSQQLLRAKSALAMQLSAFDMLRAGLPGWREVLVAGFDAPGEVPEPVYQRALQLLLMPDPASAATQIESRGDKQ